MSRHRLQATMESLAKKRQKEFDEMSKWSNQIQYYKNWDRHNNKYQSWTSNDSYKNSLSQYDALKASEKKEEDLHKRREKLRQIFFEEEQEFDLEIQNSPRGRERSNGYKMNETPTEVLKDVNIGLKLVEDDRRRHEAELKLYHQWKSDNPIIRNFESTQNRTGLKLAWLDQQIEKRMELEKTEEEMKKLIQERDARIKEEEILERKEREENSEKEKNMMEAIELQIKQFKLKNNEAEKLKMEEENVLRKRREIEDLVEKNLQKIQARKTREVSLYNIHQSKLKLRKKASEVEEELKAQQNIIEEILASKAAEEIQNEEKRAETIQSINSFLSYIREQKKLEDQRKKYISCIFDSEAKNMWEKQDKLWKEEEFQRDNLLSSVLEDIHHQIEENLTRNLHKQRDLLAEREEMLKNIEEHDQQMKRMVEEMAQKKFERKLELDKQIKEKKALDYQKKLEEEKKKKEEWDHLKKEEDKLRHELMKIQSRQYPQARFNRRIIW